jgi:hypothetical protein
MNQRASARTLAISVADDARALVSLLSVLGLVLISTGAAWLSGP